MAKIELQKIVKQFDATTVVHGIDLTIEDGEFVVFVGPSGCGKSTMLRMIAGLEDISGGTLRIGGDVVNHREPKHRNIAMVFQNYAIYPHLTVRQNIGFGLYTSKLPKAEKDKRILETARLLGLEPYLDRRPAALSGGQRQRVAIGRAMVRSPSAFLFDEPLSNLDAQLRGQMRLEIKQLHQRLGATIVFVTHDQVEAMSLADRIVVMPSGPLRLGGVFENGGSRSVMVGLRPQELTLASSNDNAYAIMIEGTVRVAEPHGSETFVLLDMEKGALVARAPSSVTYRPGDRLRFGAREENIRIFDRSTEKLLH